MMIILIVYLGITSDGRIKVIKMGVAKFGEEEFIQRLGTAYDFFWLWNQREGTSYDWTNATIRTRLNNTSSGYYLASLGDYANYIDSSSLSKFYSTATIGVASPVYIEYDSTSGDNQSATNLYSLETGGTIASYSGEGYKVGLMQLSDYYLAVGDNANCSESGSYSTCKLSWINITNNDIRRSEEWVAARQSADNAWLVADGGMVSYCYLGDGFFSVRPVFYLKSDIELKGNGTKESPYYIVTD